MPGSYVYTPRTMLAAIGKELMRCENIFKNEEDPAMSLQYGKLHIALRVLSMAIVDRPGMAMVDETTAKLVAKLFPSEEFISYIELQTVREFVTSVRASGISFSQHSPTAP